MTHDPFLMLDMEILACMGGSPNSPQLLKLSRDIFMHSGMVKFNKGGKYAVASLVCKAKFSCKGGTQKLIQIFLFFNEALLITSDLKVMSVLKS